MGLMKIRTEGGSGGKRGHFNMEHWAHIDEIKRTARARRRMADKREVHDQNTVDRSLKIAPILLT